MDEKKMKLVTDLAACQAICNNCFKSCLQEENVKMMARCVKLDKECAEICGLSLSLVSSDSEFAKEALKLCIEACKKCAEECKKFQHPHCKECAKSCESCADACKAYI